MTEEKVLIKSIRSEKAYRNNLILIYSLSAGSAFFFAFFFSLEMGFETFGMCFWLWLLMFSTPFALIFHFILKKIFDRVSIVVTNYKVTGAYGFKEQMNIPIDSISSVTTNSSFLSAIGFTCAGNAYRMSYIENRKEIIEVVNKLIAERATNKGRYTPPIQAEQNVNSDIATELKKYKSLLDDGLITQEEYEAKKKQLLNL